MSKKSHLIGLMAKREAAQLANVRRGYINILRQHEAAQNLSERLESLLDSRRFQGAAAMSVANLREHRRLSDQLAAEAERNRMRALQLEAEVKKAAAEMAQKDHRKRVLDDAALAARKTEAMQNEERADAARSTGRRR